LAETSSQKGVFCLPENILPLVCGCQGIRVGYTSYKNVAISYQVIETMSMTRENNL
jgi:hypothetical protein